MNDRIDTVEEWTIRFHAATYPRLSKLFPYTVSLVVALGQFEQYLADGEAQDAELERLRARVAELEAELKAMQKRENNQSVMLVFEVGIQ